MPLFDIIFLFHMVMTEQNFSSLILLEIRASCSSLQPIGSFAELKIIKPLNQGSKITHLFKKLALIVLH